MGSRESKVVVVRLSGKRLLGATSQLISSCKMKSLLIVLVTVAGGLGMDLGEGGVYDSPMAQDYYVKRFGFMFGGGRSGMSGIKALRNKGMLQTKLKTDAVQQMKNSVESYYKEVLPQTRTAPRPHHKNIRLRKEKEMVELAPQMKGDVKPKMFYPLMAVP